MEVHVGHALLADCAVSAEFTVILAGFTVVIRCNEKLRFALQTIRLILAREAIAGAVHAFAWQSRVQVGNKGHVALAFLASQWAGAHFTGRQARSANFQIWIIEKSGIAGLAGVHC